jgi:hypothetical protein
MTNNSATIRPNIPDPPAGIETKQQKFERILSQDAFKGLKAILDHLHTDRGLICDGVSSAGSYPELVTRLGYAVILAPQIHVQDCYSRVGRAGGIRAVLPYHDTATYSTLVTLVNFDSTLTTTAKSVGFFGGKLAELKTQLKN